MNRGKKLQSIYEVLSDFTKEEIDAAIGTLTDEEKEIVRRGRNQENHHLPKNVNTAEYSYSTAFEALIGYLYLAKKEERLEASPNNA